MKTNSKGKIVIALLLALILLSSCNLTDLQAQLDSQLTTGDPALDGLDFSARTNLVNYVNDALATGACQEKYACAEGWAVQNGNQALADRLARKQR